MTVVAAAQLAPVIGDADGNRRTAAAAVTDAAAAGAELVVLPELCDSGYVFASAQEARGLATAAADSPTLRQWRELAAAHGIVIVGGFCELGGDGRLWNSAALVDATGTRAIYRKAHLWDAEQDVFTPGSAEPPVVGTAWGRIGVMVCYAAEFPEWVRKPALAGADLLAVPTNWPAEPKPAGERPAVVLNVQSAASANRIFIAAADRCGTERGVSWVGGTVIAGVDAYPLAGPVCADEPAVLVADCDLRLARSKANGPRNDVHADRRTDLYG
jgi:predicted amidohydrolase